MRLICQYNKFDSSYYGSTKEVIMLLKNLKKKGMAVALALAASLSFAPAAFANNHADTGWSTYLSSWQTSDTPNRQKQDASLGYIKATSVSKGRTIRSWMLNYSNKDVNSATVNLKSGQYQYVYNSAYQRFGRSQVHMRLQHAYSYSGTTQAYGVWSPDSA